jgi:hypothetical protein
MSKVRSERKPKAKPQARRRRLDRFVRQDAGFLAEQIDAVATLMWALAERMEYFAGFNGEMVKHSREMAGASVIARKWATAIRKPNPTADRRATEQSKKENL